MTKMEIAHSIKNKIVNNINLKTIVLFIREGELIYGRLN